jgi:hypothetical protein
MISLPFLLTAMYLEASWSGRKYPLDGWIDGEAFFAS